MVIFAIIWFAVTGITLIWCAQLSSMKVKRGLVVVLWWQSTCSSGVVCRDQQIDLACSSHWPHLQDFDDYHDDENDDDDENNDETFMMVALSSRSAWSISALSLTLIFKLSLRKLKMINIAQYSNWFISHWFDWNLSCLRRNLMRAKRVVVNVTLPFLLIGMFILIDTTMQVVKLGCWWWSPYQSLVGHLVRALLAKAEGRVDVLQNFQGLRVMNFTPDKRGWLKIWLMDNNAYTPLGSISAQDVINSPRWWEPRMDESLLDNG